MPSLIHCIYASAATRPPEAGELAMLLEQARTNNQRLGLTGMLLYTEGSYFQALEGEAEVVDALYAKILVDTRHVQVTKVLSEAIAVRSFDTWTMGFSTATRKELATISGLDDFFHGPKTFTAIDAGRATKLLAAFAEGRWRQRLAGAR